VDTILDLDLDFFVWPIEYEPEGTGRLCEVECTHASPDDVRQFLEARCLLQSRWKIPGHEMVEHQDAFFTWRRWVRDGVLTAPFDVIHIDAHADLGLGDSGWVYLLSELLALPPAERSNPRCGPKELNSGNYLAFAIANRWIRNLTYVFPHPKAAALPVQEFSIKVFTGDELVRTISPEAADNQKRDPRPVDLMSLLFRNRDARTKLIELRRYSPDTVRDVADLMRAMPEAIHVEPAVPFKYVPADQFSSDGFTHMLVAQSPQFTPATADQLLPIFRDYFTEV
jgi:hypothetical protein